MDTIIQDFYKNESIPVSKNEVNKVMVTFFLCLFLFM